MQHLPFWHPDRPRLKMKPLTALKHFRKLIENKEDTTQVFHIFKALPRKKMFEESKAFCESERGQALYESEPALPPLLDDHDALRAMPEGSVAHAYVEFMEREGLSAQGLVDEFRKFEPNVYADQFEWYLSRNRDTHDLLHILTGYGRDALGEACVLAFTYGQNPAPGHLFIAYLAGRQMKKQQKTGAPIYEAIHQARRNGRGAPKVIEQDIMAMMARPLAEVRAEFGIGEPTEYRKCHEMFRAGGYDPYDILGTGPNAETEGQLAAA